jgi:transposase
VINFAPELKIFLHNGPVDMRKSFDGLFGIVSTAFERDARDGGLFLFLNKRRDRIKLLWWDRDGLVIFMKRLEGGLFEQPAPRGDAKHIVLDSTELQMLLSGIELRGIKKRKRYSRPSREASAAAN